MPLAAERGILVTVGTTTSLHSSVPMGSLRRSRGLSDIAPQYVAKSGLCTPSEMESSRGGSIRIQLLTNSPTAAEGRSRFPKLDECAHFHYEHVELGPLQVSLCEEEDLKPLSNDPDDNKWWSVSVSSQNKTWLIRRSYENFRMLDQQLHRCIYDRKFSGLKELPVEIIEEQENIHELLCEYLSRFSILAGSLINCGPVLNWLEMDNRGHRLLVPDTDNCPINTPAVAAAYAVKRYAAQAADEISFEVGDMISVIDMPPPEESIWWRGKRGFQVGFFPCECVAVIGDKVPRNLHFSPRQNQPTKPVLRKHGKLIAFFRSFILSRPSRRRLKQSGILKERVFGCDLGEHLLNSGHEIPMVLKCCAEFIETNGIVDGIYRLSGVTSNIQKLRNAFDEDRVPGLYDDQAIVQDIHSVASLLKMYFRELPNPLCTYQLYHQFVNAVQTADNGDDNRLVKMRDVVQKLPPPHYRTLDYLMRHLARVAERGNDTGMTPRNVAIVWAPNLLRCKELEVGGVAALQGVGVQAVVTEFLICYSDLIFCDRLPHVSVPPQQVTPKRSRPKSLAISTPTKLLSLEEARTRALLQAAGKPEQDYIEVGGGPSSLPAKYHTVIELPSGSRKRSGSKRSPLGWKSIFGKSVRSSQSRKENQRKVSTPCDLGLLNVEKAVTESDLVQSKRRLRPAKSVESLNSGNTSRNSATLDVTEVQGGMSSPDDTLSPIPLRNVEIKGNGHNRSVSHDSYFDQLAENQEDDKFNSNLDISEIQLNFDLEESEMRIFSEDETLMSVGSGSMVSQSSPRILLGQKMHKSQGLYLNNKLSHARLARGEESVSSSQSADPSPKKLKTSEHDEDEDDDDGDDSVCKRSRLEQQLTSSGGDLQFIDCVSPEQVVVMAEVHVMQSPSPVSSLSQLTNTSYHTSPILPHIPHLQRPLSQQITSSTTTTTEDRRPKSQQINFIKNSYNTSETSQQQDKQTCSSKSKQTVETASSEMSPSSHVTSPSIAEATISDNESLSLHSSGLTTPDTPLQPTYSPLLDTEESSFSNTTTPDNEGLDKLKKNTSENENLDKKMSRINTEFNNDKNIGQEYEKFEKNILELSNDELLLETKLKESHKYENITTDMLKIIQDDVKTEIMPVPEERKSKPKQHPYENVPITKLLQDEKKNVENPLNILLETSFDSVGVSDSCVEVADKRDSQASIKYVNISTESSCDSLININKTDECHKLLLTNRLESDNPSPILENVWLSEQQVDLIDLEPPSPEQVDLADLLLETQVLEPVDLIDLQLETQVQTSVSLLDLESITPVETTVDVVDEPVTPLEKAFALIDLESVTPVNTAVGVVDLEPITPVNTTVGGVDLEPVAPAETAVDLVDLVDSKSASPQPDTVEESSCQSPCDKLLETSFEYVEKDETCIDIENALLNLANSPKRMNRSDKCRHKMENIDSERERKLSTDVCELVIVDEDSQSASVSGSVKQLLTKFEVCSNNDFVDLNVDYEKSKLRKSSKNLSPCEKAKNLRQSKQADDAPLEEDVEDVSVFRKKQAVVERPKTIERIPSRRRSEDNWDSSSSQCLEKSKSGTEIDTTSVRTDFGEELNVDLSDPQRRERIEKYKEKRRNYLREKYRTDSFKNDNEEFLTRIKQKTIAEKDKSETSRKAPFEKPARKIIQKETNVTPIKPERKQTSEKRTTIDKPVRRSSTGGKIQVVDKMKSPERVLPPPGRKDFYKRSYSVDGSNGKYTTTTKITTLTQTRHNTSLSKDSFDIRSPPGSSPVKKTPEKNVITSVSPEVVRSAMVGKKKSSSCESGIESSRSSFESRSSLDQTKSMQDKQTVEPLEQEEAKSPSYCIKEMTALFERKDTTKEPHKQYLSSV